MNDGGLDRVVPADGVVAEFIRAFNDGDVDALLEILHPDVELHSNRGLRQGHEAARKWALRAPGGAQQTILVEGMEGTEGPDATAVVVALISRRWHWEEDGSLAGEDQMAWLFQLREGLVTSWRPFEHRAEALLSAEALSAPGLRG
jgi:limonene-1,2-epoxide hydrolase